MLVVQNLAKENYLLKFKMAAMPIHGKKHSIFSIYMLIVQNLVKKNYLLKFKMAAMPIHGKKRSKDFSRTTVPVSLIFCMKHMGHLTI